MIPGHVQIAVSAALAELPGRMDTPEARALLYAIGLQESRFEHRRQLIKRAGVLVPEGPAKGYWQFERLGGCAGIVQHAASRYWANALCSARGLPFTATAIWNAIEVDDALAAGAARLLLFTDPKALPVLGDERGAWNLYLRTWRPGAWDRGTTAARADLRAKWSRNYAEALEHVGVAA